MLDAPVQPYRPVLSEWVAITEWSHDRVYVNSRRDLGEGVIPIADRCSP